MTHATGNELDALADHGEIFDNSITGTYEDARRVLNDLAAVGIDYDESWGPSKIQAYKGFGQLRSDGRTAPRGPHPLMLGDDVERQVKGYEQVGR